jgi:glutamyl-Q tRNA(Asp) synthetase
MSIVTRFAPSPTGLLHLGSAFSALVAWRRARDPGGKFLVRLEDIDRTRCRPEYAALILEDLEWLGLDWDGEVRVQSQHFAEYQATLDHLAARGLLYPCFCTRSDIHQSATAPHTPDGAPLYPGTCRTMSDDEREARNAAGVRYAMRLDMERALQCVEALTFHEESEGDVVCHPEQFGDVVLARKDTPASYHLCVTHDDALQGVTLVTRGEDLKPATHLHRLLQALMGWPAPQYAHHPLLIDPSGRRLAKRDRDLTVQALHTAGRTPGEIRELVLRTSRTSPCWRG